MGGISMTIGEKAKEYESNIGSQDYVPIEIEETFKAGAEWMLEKTVKWLKENAQNYYEDASMHDNCWYDDEQMIEDFQKAMEE